MHSLASDQLTWFWANDRLTGNYEENAAADASAPLCFAQHDSAVFELVD
jgi:hypothetical protein